MDLIRRTASIPGLVGLIVTVSAVLPSDAPASTQPLSGVMAFGWGNNFQNSPSVTLPYVDGFTAYFAWRDLETAEGVYDFEAIDALLEHTSSAGKVLNIGIYAGSHTPDWAYKQHMTEFRWMRPLKEDQAIRRGKEEEMRSPFPWDPKYLKLWERFMGVVIRRYGGNEHVGYISITGPTIRDLTNGILLRNDADWNRFRDGVDVEQRLVDAWIDVIEQYQSINSSQRYALAIGPMRPGSSDVTVAQRITNYVEEHGYTNIALMSVFLNDTWFDSGLGSKRIRAILRDAKQKGFTIGYQMAQSAQRNSTWKKNKPIVESLAKSFDYGLDDGMQWVEVWHDDIIDRRTGGTNNKYSAEIRRVHEALTGKSAR